MIHFDFRGEYPGESSFSPLFTVQKTIEDLSWSRFERRRAPSIFETPPRWSLIDSRYLNLSTTGETNFEASKRNLLLLIRVSSDRVFYTIRSLSLCFISLIIRREETTVREISSSMNSLIDRFFSSIYMICSMIFARTNSCVFLGSYISPLDIYIAVVSLLLLNANGKRKIFFLSLIWKEIRGREEKKSCRYYNS